MNLYNSSRRSKSDSRKSLQLCKQVERTLNLVLSGESHDDVLRDLLVAGVKPFAGTGQLLVMVQPIDSQTAPPVGEILEHLQQAKGQLREAVAGAISRRKVPDLMFQVVGPVTTSL